MTLKRYILFLHNLENRNPDLENVPVSLLRPFIDNNAASTYNCYQFINSVGMKTSYKNVHKKIQKLYSSGLIKKIDRIKPTKHDAVFYRLSSFGSYYIIRNTRWGTDLLSNYAKEPLFQIILDPFISIASVKQLDGPETLMRINEHLQKCCDVIDRQLKKLDEVKRYGRIDILCRWDDILIPVSSGVNSFIKFLKESLKINWIDDRTLITLKSQDVIKISSKNHVLYAKHSNSKVTLFSGRQKIYQFDVWYGYHKGLCCRRRVPPHIGIGKFTPFDLESEIVSICEKIDDEIIDSALELCFGLVKNYPWASLKKESLNDYNVLANDYNFKHLFETTHNRFNLFKDKLISVPFYELVASEIKSKLKRV